MFQPRDAVVDDLTVTASRRQKLMDHYRWTGIKKAMASLSKLRFYLHLALVLRDLYL